MRFWLSFLIVGLVGGVVFACGSSASSNTNPAGNPDGSAASQNDGSNSSDDGSSPVSEGGGGSTFDGPVFKAGTPITATADQWTFIPFDNAFCV